MCYAAGYRLRDSLLITLLYFVIFAVGFPGNLMSAKIWVRASMLSRKNSSAVFLAALASVDLVLACFLTFVYVAVRDVQQQLNAGGGPHVTDAMYKVVFTLQYLAAGLVLAVSAHRLIVLRFPSRVSLQHQQAARPVMSPTICPRLLQMATEPTITSFFFV